MNTMRTGLAVVLTLSFALSAPQADACLFCSELRGPTLTEDFSKSALVLVGTCSNPKFGPNGFDDSTTEFKIEEVVKPHESIKGKTKIVLPRYIADVKNKHLVFADVYKGQLDFYLGLPIAADSSMVKYLK